MKDKLFLKLVKYIVFLTFIILICIFLNCYLIYKIQYVEFLNFIYFNLFSFIKNVFLQNIFNILFLLLIFGIFQVFIKRIFRFFKRFFRTFGFFTPFLVHYFIISILALIVSALVFSRNFYQKMFWFDGDYVVFIALLFASSFVSYYLIGRYLRGIPSKISEEDFDSMIQPFLNEKDKILFDKLYYKKDDLYIKNKKIIKKDRIFFHKLLELIKYKEINYEEKSKAEMPINNPSEDIIGFNDLVENTCEEIISLKNNHSSYLIGLLGEWGAGKTSLLNLIDYTIKYQKIKENKDYRKIATFYFNVSKYSNLSILYIHCYQEIFKILKEYYTMPFKYSYNMINAVLETVGDDKKLNFIFNFAFPLLDIEEYNNIISDFLVKNNTRIVILIDDIDRLQPDDIDNVFKLLRLIRNIENIVIIMTADPKILENYKKDLVGNAIEKDLIDFIGKYFDKIYYVPVINIMRLENDFINQVEKIICKHINSKNDIKEIKEEIGREKLFIIDLVTKNIVNFRKFKSFLKVFEHKIDMLRRDIYIPDVIVLSILEVTNVELFNFIKNNKDFLKLNYGWIDYFNYKNINLLKKEKSEYKKFFEKNKMGQSEEKIIYWLFPHIEIILDYEIKHNEEINYPKEIDSLINDYEIKQRFAHPVIIQKYFHYFSPDDIIEKITDKEYKTKILEKCSKENINHKKIAKDLQILFPEDNDLYRQMSLNWFKRKIIEENLIISYNLLIILSILTKNFEDNPHSFLFNEKFISAKSIWGYLTKKDSDKNILIKLIELDNSDIFSIEIIFDFTEKEESLRYINIQKELKDKVVKTYLDRVNKKIKDNNLFDLLNLKNTDSPIQLIWRWRDAEQYLQDNNIDYKIDKNLNDFIYLSLISCNIDNFCKFIDNFDIFSTIRGYILKEEYIEDLIGIDNFKQIVCKFDQDSLKKALGENKYSALENWINKTDRGTEENVNFTNE